MLGSPFRVLYIALECHGPAPLKQLASVCVQAAALLGGKEYEWLRQARGMIWLGPRFAAMEVRAGTVSKELSPACQAKPLLPSKHA